MLNNPSELWGVLQAGGLAYRAFDNYPTFQRCFRDLHAGSQHAMVSPMHTYEFAGRLLADAEDGA